MSTHLSYLVSRTKGLVSTLDSPNIIPIIINLQERQTLPKLTGTPITTSKRNTFSQWRTSAKKRNQNATLWTWTLLESQYIPTVRSWLKASKKCWCKLNSWERIIQRRKGVIRNTKVKFSRKVFGKVQASQQPLKEKVARSQTTTIVWRTLFTK